MSEQYLIEIKTRADLTAAEASKQSLIDQRKELIKLGQDAGEVERKLVATERAIQQAKATSRDAAKIAGEEKPKGLVGQGLEKLANIARGQGAVGEGIASIAELANGPLGAIAAAGALLKTAWEGAVDSVKEFAKAEEAVTGMDAALAQQGQLTDEMREKYQALAGELQELTGIATGEWAGVLARLTQFGANPDNIGMSASGVKNLAGLLGGDLQSAALMVGKALEGNFQSFTRLGIHIDENLAQGQKLEQLWRELAARGGGQLEARAKTLSGAMAALKNNLSDVKEDVGLSITQMLNLKGAVELASGAFEWWHEVLGHTIPKVEDLENAAHKTVDAAAELDAVTRRLAALDEEMARQSEALTAAMDRKSTALKEEKEDQDRLATSIREHTLAEIHLQEVEGKITPKQAAEARAVVNRKFNDDQGKRDQKAIQQQADIIDDRARRINVELTNAMNAKSKADFGVIQAQRADKKEGNQQSRAADEKRLLEEIKEAEAEALEQRVGFGPDSDQFHSANEDVTAAYQRYSLFKRSPLLAEERHAQSVAAAQSKAAAAKEKLENVQKSAAIELPDLQAQRDSLSRQSTNISQVNQVKRGTEAINEVVDVRGAAAGPGDAAILSQAENHLRTINGGVQSQNEVLGAVNDGLKTTADLLAGQRVRLDALTATVNQLRAESLRQKSINTQIQKGASTP